MIRSLFAALMLLLGGGVFIAVGLWIVPEHPPNEVVTHGRIAGVGGCGEPLREEDGPSGFVTVEYDADGRTYLARGPAEGTTGAACDLRPGDHTEVWYDRENPAHAVVPLDNWFGWVFVGLGAIVGLFGLFAALGVVRRLIGALVPG